MAQLDENCDETPRGHEGASPWIKAGTDRTAQGARHWFRVAGCTILYPFHRYRNGGRKGLAP